MKWNRSEIDRLSPILEQISADLAPVDGKRILILGSAAGEMVFRLAEMMELGRVTGLELDPEALELARRSAHEMGLEDMVEFLPGDRNNLAVKDESYDALVSEFIVYPSSQPAEISQVEMARGLRPGGKMILTDVLLTRSLDDSAREELAVVGLDYLCEATLDDFRGWMDEAHLTENRILDLSETLRPVWEARREVDQALSHERGYEILLDDPATRLGKAIHYIYAMGSKPNPTLLG
jgi:cyclopropane fatty-acyl-phospholipid synthase-like methyltransferase